MKGGRKKTSFTIPPEIAQVLADLATRHRCSKTEVIVRALKLMKWAGDGGVVKGGIVIVL